MTNQDNNNPQAEGATIEHNPNETREPKRYGVTFMVGVGLAAVIAIGAGAALAQGGFGPKGFGPMGARFAEHRFEKLMDEVDATDAQQDKIWAIVDRTRSELRPVGREFRDSRGKVAELLAAPTIDKAAVEALRAERIAAVDAASKKAVAALVEAAEVLTPEQRAELAKELKERHEGRW